MSLEIPTDSPWSEPVTIKTRTQQRINAATGTATATETTRTVDCDFYPKDGDETEVLSEGLRAGAQYILLLPIAPGEDVQLGDTANVSGTEYVIRDRKPWGNFLELLLVLPE